MLLLKGNKRFFDHIKKVGIVLAVPLLLTGCSGQDWVDSTNNSINPEVSLKQLPNSNIIYYDSETGVEYWYMQHGRSSEFTVRVDADGKPIIYEGWQKGE